MAAVMAAAGLNYEVIVKWESGLYKKFSNKDNPPDDYTAFDPNKGYWVNVSSNAFVLQPKLLSTVRGDVDNEPQGNYPAPEDLKLSDSPTPLDPSAQTHIVFLEGEDAQQLSLANTGGGILLWSLKWQPADATNVNWLTLNATQGITTVENDIVTVGLDRKNLVKGVYRGTLTLETSAGNRVFQVVANVSGVVGEWRGSAKVTSVNSLRNPVPDIDLFLSFYEDPSVPGLMRGYMDGQNALLWPVDVPLIGHVESSTGNTLSLSGGYILPPGDQNNPPYEQFNTALEDVDWNGNHVIDSINPFPFPIYRSVTLVGELKTASQSDGYTLEGNYLEMVYGMLRTPIRLEGTFSIRRESATPFADRRPVLNQESTNPPQPVVWLGTNFTVGVPLNGTVLQKLTFKTDMVLQGISVSLSISGAVASNLTISLIAPNSSSILLHNHGNISSNTLASLNYPNTRAPVQPFSNLLAGGVPSKGDWYLSIAGTGGTLKSWSLRLQGQPVFDVSGRVINSQGGGLPAEVFLDGLPISQIAEANPDGTFVFGRVPGIPLNFTANLIGYQAFNPLQPGLSSLFTTPSFPTNGLSAAALALAAKFRPLPVMPIPAYATDGFTNYGSAASPVQIVLSPRTDEGPALSIAADPPSGFGPLTVHLTLLAGTNALPPLTPVTWLFGDGQTTNGVGLFSVQHTYGSVSTIGFVAQAQTGLGAPTTQVLVNPSPGFTPYSNNFFQVFFTSGGTVPTNLIDEIPPSYPTNSPPQLVELIRIQHADCASFDIDRAPYTTVTNRNFFADGFSTNGQISAGNNSVAIPMGETIDGFKEEDSNYYLDPNIWLANLWTYVGDCGYAVDDSNFDVHPKPNVAPTFCNGPRYRMLCNIGPQIIPPPNDEVYSISPTLPPLVPPTPDPLLALGREGIAASRDFRMVTGPLAWSWNLARE
jgi:subtilisin-like proprotein convertase family protein